MRALVVHSKDVFDRKKNPKIKLSVKSLLENQQIPKHCCQCGTELTVLEIFEDGKEDTMLACHKCQFHGDE